jgi:hypothetical protein
VTSEESASLVLLLASSIPFQHNLSVDCEIILMFCMKLAIENLTDAGVRIHLCHTLGSYGTVQNSKAYLL